jgi:hypothetical protein
MNRRRLLGIVCVPVIALGLVPRVAHATGPATVWKVLIHEEANKLVNGGEAVKLQLSVTCPEGATGVVVDVTVDQPLYLIFGAWGEAEAVPVSCTGEETTKWITVTESGYFDVDFFSGQAHVRAVLDRSGTDWAEDDRFMRLGGGSGTTAWLSIQNGSVINGGVSHTDVEVDYLCPSASVGVTIDVFVDQELSGPGDAEGDTSRYLPCTGHRQSATFTVTANDESGTFTYGNAAIYAQFDWGSWSESPTIGQYGEFNLS